MTAQNAEMKKHLKVPGQERVKVVMSLILLVALSRAKIWRERTLRFDDGISAAFI